MCFCYDDIDNCQPDDFFYVDEHGKRQEKPQLPEEEASGDEASGEIESSEFMSTNLPPLLEIVNREFRAYVAVVVPKNVGGRKVKYRICREENDGEDCSEEDVIATFDFEIARNSSQDIAISSEGFTIKENLFLPYSWQLSKPTDFKRENVGNGNSSS